MGAEDTGSMPAISPQNVRGYFQRIEQPIDYFNSSLRDRQLYGPLVARFVLAQAADLQSLGIIPPAGEELIPFESLNVPLATLYEQYRYDVGVYRVARQNLSTLAESLGANRPEVIAAQLTERALAGTEAELLAVDVLAAIGAVLKVRMAENAGESAVSATADVEPQAIPNNGKGAA